MITSEQTAFFLRARGVPRVQGSRAIHKTSELNLYNQAEPALGILGGHVSGSCRGQGRRLDSRGRLEGAGEKAGSKSITSHRTSHCWTRQSASPIIRVGYLSCLSSTHSELKALCTERTELHAFPIRCMEDMTTDSFCRVGA